MKKPGGPAEDRSGPDKALARTLKDKAARDIDAHRRGGGDDDSAA